MAVVVVATPFVVLNWLDSYTLHGKAIEVPNVCGMSIDEGAERLKKSSLGYEIVDYKYQRDCRHNRTQE